MKNILPTAPLHPDEVRRLQEIEDNPFTPEDEAMFAMFERKGWDAEQRISYIRGRFSTKSPQAAE